MSIFWCWQRPPRTCPGMRATLMWPLKLSEGWAPAEHIHVQEWKWFVRSRQVHSNSVTQCLATTIMCICEVRTERLIQQMSCHGIAVPVPEGYCLNVKKCERSIWSPMMNNIIDLVRRCQKHADISTQRPCWYLSHFPLQSKDAAESMLQVYSLTVALVYIRYAHYKTHWENSSITV